MLDRNQLLPLNDPAFQLSLPVEDSKLIATNVTADQWELVADTLAGLQVFASRDDLDARRAAAHIVVRLDADTRDSVRVTLTSLERARAALQPLATSD